MMLTRKEQHVCEVGTEVATRVMSAKTQTFSSNIVIKQDLFAPTGRARFLLGAPGVMGPIRASREGCMYASVPDDDARRIVGKCVGWSTRGLGRVRALDAVW